jgi:DNA-binding MarR family transcriptional regulator
MPTSSSSRRTSARAAGVLIVRPSRGDANAVARDHEEVARRLTDSDYTRLLEFRRELRRFLHWSEEEASAAGLTPAQHQLMLAVRGSPGDEPPTIGALADLLLLRHHSVVELVDRAEAAGLVQRQPDPDDHRVVRVALTRDGGARLEALSATHLEELDRLRRALGPLADGLPSAP